MNVSVETAAVVSSPVARAMRVAYRNRRASTQWQAIVAVPAAPDS